MEVTTYSLHFMTAGRLTRLRAFDTLVLRRGHSRSALDLPSPIAADFAAFDQALIPDEAVPKEIGLTGTKLGCGEGGCGACTVMLSRKLPAAAAPTHMAINACLCPLYAVAGCQVITVEGIGNVRSGLHPVQARLAAAHGSQCGFCTPGFVMSMYALLRSSAAPPGHAAIEDALAGNLCRCTGYRPILDAFAPFAAVDPAVYTDDAIQARRTGKPLTTGKICPSSGLPCSCGAGSSAPAAPNGGAWAEPVAPVPNGLGSAANTNGDTSAANGKAGCGSGPGAGATNGCSAVGCCKGASSGSDPALVPSSKSCEPIFPPELFAHVPGDLCIEGGRSTWHRCTTLPGLLDLKARHPGAKLVGGNTEIGIEMRVKGAHYPVLIDATLVPEMRMLRETEAGLEVGGAATLTELLRACNAAVAARPAAETRTCAAVAAQLRWFAGMQIRNVATLAGNVVTGSPISDLNPLWVASGAQFTVASAARGERRVCAADFFQGYRKVALEADEVLLRVTIPWTRPLEFVREFKQAHRRDDDIALVNAGMRLLLAPRATAAGGSGAGNSAGKGEEALVVQEARIAFGGVAPTVKAAAGVEQLLVGRVLDAETVKAAIERVREDVFVEETAPGGMGAYRSALAASFLFKFLVHCGAQLGAAAGGGRSWPGADELSAVAAYDRPAPEGVQFHADAAPAEIVGQPLQHRAADLQVCGEAKYTDDVPLPANCLHAALVTSPVPHAELVSVDAAPALDVPGVAGFFAASDVPGGNDIGATFRDELCFAESTVTCVGQVIGVVVADSPDEAKRAAAAVKVEVKELPPVISIEEAIAADSYHPQYDRTLTHGDVDAAFGSDDVAGVVEGEVRMGGQEHFYLEPHCCFVQPQENDEFLMVASTQDVTKHQKMVSHVLGVPMHKLVSKTKRLGGGFGGKETRGAFLHCAAAVAAFHTRRPVRLVLDRQQDMQITGQRHAFLGRYKVAYARDGRVLALDLQLYSNAGNSVDLSHAIMDRAILHSDCAFHIPAVRIRGRLCRTNQASHTAFRGFGGPQGMLVCNVWMDHIARALGAPLDAVQRVNLYREGAVTHFGQKLTHNRLTACWDEVMAMAEHARRRRDAAAFNAAHRYRKRGVAVVPTKFGISFTFKPMNQAGALVNVYLDGSVAVTHGGVEMGQGLHTKMCQVAAQALGVPVSTVHIAETSTDKVPNSSPTAASASSDLYGAAVLDACQQLTQRLRGVRERLGPDAPMHDIAQAAWAERIDLCAHGFYRTPDITGADGDMPFNYFVYGAAVAEVELDCLTGDWHNVRTDIVMDVGNPINPAIDIGQVEGGFVQGMGWLCLEELKWGDGQHPWIRPGVLLTQGPGNYKIPTANDIPVDFRVKLLQNAPNVRAVHSSKAVGEPPFHLGSSVFFALKDAVYAARSHAGLTGFFRLDAPATPERLRMACVDDFTGPKPDYIPALSC